ncbi:helix-turn-helix domain-containing protein [Rapidithrix thailandica]|uniref:Helix-turn-helix domain-containing protein n=1 Tax=Rapidithrix thailandica TaxID=413964 RepID=A0AAW9SFM3_9BACT
MSMITRKEMADMYGVSYSTIRRYLKAIGIDNPRRISPKEMKQFVEHYGEPDGWE